MPPGSFRPPDAPRRPDRPLAAVRGVIADVVNDGRDALPEPLLGIDTNTEQVRFHEIQDGLEMAEEHPLAGFDVLGRTPPFGYRRIGITAFAPDANDKNSGAIFQQCHGDRLG